MNCKKIFSEVDHFPEKTYVFNNECEHAPQGYDPEKRTSSTWDRAPFLYLKEGKWVCSRCCYGERSYLYLPSLRDYMVWLIADEPLREAIEDIQNKISELVEVMERILIYSNTKHHNFNKRQFKKLEEDIAKLYRVKVRMMENIKVSIPFEYF